MSQLRPAVTWRALVVLAAYVVFFPPLFVLGPLAGLLVASRPRSVREWAWIGAAALWLLVTLGQPGGLAPQMLHAWALFVTGAFVVLMLSGRCSLISGALLASAFGFGAATVWAWLLGSRWQDIQLAVAHTGWEFCRQLLAQSNLAPDALDGLRSYVNSLADAVGVLAQLFPGLLILTALPGLVLAWTWYHRLSAHPTGTPGGRFAEFRFSDHLVWLVVGCVAGFVLPLPDALHGLLGNLAVVTGGLYAARGAAVAWRSVEPFSLGVLAILLLGVLFILPVALGGFFSVGLADTWVDFRRRFASAGSREE
ncbi:MAG TPA: DUF2232 domain-containing protein [Gemmatimonadales bacterium]